MKKIFLFMALFATALFGDSRDVLVDEYLKKSAYYEAFERMKQDITVEVSADGIQKANEVFRPQNLKEIFVRVSKDSLSDDDLKQFITFYNSPLGIKYVKTVNESDDVFGKNMVKIDEDMEHNRVSKDRLKLFDEFIVAIDIDRVVKITSDLMVNVNSKQEASSVSVKKDISDYMKSMAPFIYQTLLIDFSDSEVKALVKQYKSHVGKKELEVVYEVMEEISKQLIQ